MNQKRTDVIELDPAGFNELKMCRSGPMVYNKHDIFIGGSLKAYGEFSVFEQALFQQVIHRGEVVVEVGANIGAHTIELSRLVGDDGEVHAFEPQRIVFQTLCANLALNQCRNVYAYQVALGAKPGQIHVPAMDPTTPANFGGVSLGDTPQGERVPLITLDSLDLPACHVLKADVEGMELEVVSGALETIDRYRPIMYLENDREEKSKELLERIMGLGYAVYWHLPRLFNPNNFRGEAVDIWGNIISINVLCLPIECTLDVSGFRRVASATEHWR